MPETYDFAPAVEGLDCGHPDGPPEGERHG